MASGSQRSLIYSLAQRVRLWLDIVTATSARPARWAIFGDCLGVGRHITVDCWPAIFPSTASRNRFFHSIGNVKLPDRTRLAESLRFPAFVVTYQIVQHVNDEPTIAVDEIAIVKCRGSPAAEFMEMRGWAAIGPE